MTTQTATVRVIYFNLDYDKDNFGVLSNIDDETVYTVKSANWLPPSFDDNLWCYDQNEEFLINFTVIGEHEYRGRVSVEIEIID
jgi:hypothetical protein